VEYGENATTLEDLGFYALGQTTVRSDDGSDDGSDGHVERLFGAVVSPSLFSTLGVTPIVGRLPTEQDEPATMVLISHGLWTTWFGQDSTIIGRPLEVAGGTRTVIGVMGREFRFPEEQTAFWIADRLTGPVKPGGLGLNFIGRMSPGADHQAVVDELSSLVRRLPARFGGTADYARLIEQHRPIVRSLEQELVGDMERPLWILQGTVALLLLIACSNVANLLIVRAEGRRRDLAVRRAPGAHRLDLGRSQMAETILLVLAGAAGGVLLARFGLPLLVRAAPEGIPQLTSVQVDRTALAFAAVVAAVTATAPSLARSAGRR
jgi:hypothetical protein